MSEFPEVPVCVDTEVLSVHLHACICMHSLHVHIQEYAGVCVFTYVNLHTSPIVPESHNLGMWNVEYEDDIFFLGLCDCGA